MAKIISKEHVLSSQPRFQLGEIYGICFDLIDWKSRKIYSIQCDSQEEQQKMICYDQEAWRRAINVLDLN